MPIMRKCKVKLYIAVEVYELIVTGVHVFSTEKEQLDWYKGYTGVEHPARLIQDAGRELDDDEKEEIFEKHFEELGDDYEETKLFDVETEILIPVNA